MGYQHNANATMKALSLIICPYHNRATRATMFIENEQGQDQEQVRAENR
jgi:hypothetical protein